MYICIYLCVCAITIFMKYIHIYMCVCVSCFCEYGVLEILFFGSSVQRVCYCTSGVIKHGKLQAEKSNVWLVDVPHGQAISAMFDHRLEYSESM